MSAPTLPPTDILPNGSAGHEVRGLDVIDLLYGVIDPKVKLR